MYICMYMFIFVFLWVDVLIVLQAFLSSGAGLCNVRCIKNSRDN